MNSTSILLLHVISRKCIFLKLFKVIGLISFTWEQLIYNVLNLLLPPPTHLESEWKETRGTVKALKISKYFLEFKMPPVCGWKESMWKGSMRVFLVLFFKVPRPNNSFFYLHFWSRMHFFLFMIWNINDIDRSKWTVSTFRLWKFHNLYWIYYASLKVWGYLTMWHAMAYSSSFCYTHKLYLSRHSSTSTSVILMAQRLVKKRGNLHSFLSRH